MPKGPRLNYIKRNFTTRDSLGIEGVMTSMSADVCPIVTTVTPRAFYWPFMVWIYYDFYKYSGIVERTVTAFDTYLKRQDYFFVMATLLNTNSDRGNLVGITQAEIDINENPNGPYPYNPKYFKTKYGGMQYYGAGCISMGFTIDSDPDTGKQFALPKLSKDGEKLALSFENVIKDTEYYKNYRLNDEAVPRRVLEEYGQTINMGLSGFDKSKEMLRHRLFDNNYRLSECARYIDYLYHNYQMLNLDRESARMILFDHISQNGMAIDIPVDLKEVANQWEIIIGRQYFTSGLEMIWKSMLLKIEDPATKREWMERMLTRSEFEWNIEHTLDSVLDQCRFDNKQREELIRKGTKGNDIETNLENGIKVMLSLYNWIKEKNDFGEDKALLKYGIDSHSVSFSEFADTVDEYKNKSIKSFMIFVMNNWLCDQHHFTAFEKLMQGRDGFYYELVDERYTKKVDFTLAFQGIRLIQLMQVMKDLDMLS